MIKDYLRKRLTDDSWRKLRRRYHNLKSIFAGSDLTKLGHIYGTDKVTGHSYTEPYMTHFGNRRLKKIKLLEIGIGGYEVPTNGGESLRMWKRYFPNGRIYGLDIHDKSIHEEGRIKIFQGSQVDEKFLDDVISETGELDIIIDDGSHLNEHVPFTFECLFPKLKDGGIYVIEDTQTSYWEDFGGDGKNLDNPKTLMNFFKKLTDCVNHKEFINPGYEPTYFDQKILSIHFYHNLIFIYKGDNTEESNRLINNSLVD